MKKYQEQYFRIKRSLGKLPDDLICGEINEENMDDFVHYFQDCYHLKDWIINDMDVRRKNPNIKKEVNDFINNSKFMQICGDIANSTKHLMIDKHIKYDKDIKFEKLKIVQMYDAKPYKTLLVITGKGESTSALDIAHRCKSEWDEFIKNKIEGRYL